VQAQHRIASRLSLGVGIDRAVRAQLRRVPGSLACLLTLVTIIGVAWALVIPPWQVTDESSHFAYVQTLVQNGSLPSATRGRTYSSDQRSGAQIVGARAGSTDPATVPPNWSASAWQAYLSSVHSHPPSKSNGGGRNPASNPPLFYLYDAVPYLIDQGGTVFGQFYEMRIWAVLLLDLTTLGGWLLAGEVFGRRQSLQLVVGAICALMPMSTFISAAVNPDSLLIALWTLALWLGARVIRRGARTSDTVALCAVTACGVLTKATSYGLVFLVFASFFAAWRLAPEANRTSTLKRELKALAVLLIPVVAWLVVARAIGFDTVNQVVAVPARAHRVSATGFLDYLWQFYLPRLPFMPVAKLGQNVPASIIWNGGGVGMFGVAGVNLVALPPWVYGETALLAPFVAVGVLGVVTNPGRSRRRIQLLAATAVASLVLRACGQVQFTASITAITVLAIMVISVMPIVRRRRLTERQALLWFLCSAVFGLLLLLHATDYLIFARDHDPFMEGRYLLPIVGVFGLGVALIVASLPIRLRPMLVGLIFAGLLGLQVVSLSAVLHAYYL
jgi:4-amino-4-deoxy-L-arabinose transferase-like glycosyltransferase